MESFKRKSVVRRNVLRHWPAIVNIVGKVSDKLVTYFNITFACLKKQIQHNRKRITILYKEYISSYFWQIQMLY